MAPSPIKIKWLLPEVWCNITMTIIMCADRWNGKMIMIYMYQNRELRENASRNVLNRKILFSWTFFLRPHDFNFQHKKKIIYQIIFFKRLITNRGNPRHLGTWTSRYLDISVLTWTSRYSVLWTVRDLDETIFLTDHNCLVLINCQYFCTSSSLIYMNQRCFW